MQNQEHNQNEESQNNENVKSETDIKAENTSSTDEKDAAENKGDDAQVKELNDKYLRLYSEFDNYRKRTLKERSELIKTAAEDVFKAILPVLDDLERALKANNNVSDA